MLIRLHKIFHKTLEFAHFICTRHTNNEDVLIMAKTPRGWNGLLDFASREAKRLGYCSRAAMKLEQLFQKFPEVLGKQQNVSLVDFRLRTGVVVASLVAKNAQR